MKNKIFRIYLDFFIRRWLYIGFLNECCYLGSREAEEIFKELNIESTAYAENSFKVETISNLFKEFVNTEKKSLLSNSESYYTFFLKYHPQSFSTNDIERFFQELQQKYHEDKFSSDVYQYMIDSLEYNKHYTFANSTSFSNYSKTITELMMEHIDFGESKTQGKEEYSAKRLMTYFNPTRERWETAWRAVNLKQYKWYEINIKPEVAKNTVTNYLTGFNLGEKNAIEIKESDPEIVKSYKLRTTIPSYPNCYFASSAVEAKALYLLDISKEREMKATGIDAIEGIFDKYCNRYWNDSYSIKETHKSFDDDYEKKDWCLCSLGIITNFEEFEIIDPNSIFLDMNSSGLQEVQESYDWWSDLSFVDEEITDYFHFANVFVVDPSVNDEELESPYYGKSELIHNHGLSEIKEKDLNKYFFFELDNRLYCVNKKGKSEYETEKQLIEDGTFHLYQQGEFCIKAHDKYDAKEKFSTFYYLNLEGDRYPYEGLTIEEKARKYTELVYKEVVPRDNSEGLISIDSFSQTWLISHCLKQDGLNPIALPADNIKNIYGKVCKRLFTSLHEGYYYLFKSEKTNELKIIFALNDAEAKRYAIKELGQDCSSFSPDLKLAEHQINMRMINSSIFGEYLREEV